MYCPCVLGEYSACARSCFICWMLLSMVASFGGAVQLRRPQGDHHIASDGRAWLLPSDVPIRSPEPPPEASVCPSPARTRGHRAERRARERRSHPQPSSAYAGTACAELGEDGEDATLPEASTMASSSARWAATSQRSVPLCSHDGARPADLVRYRQPTPPRSGFVRRVAAMLRLVADILRLVAEALRRIADI